MFALTLTQPWAGLVASGIKLVENRPRAMIKRECFGKRFAIHASREFKPHELDRIYEVAPDMRPLSTTETSHWLRLAAVTSAVIAVATLRDAMYIGGCNAETIAKAVDRAGLAADQVRWTFGPTAYVLDDVRALAQAVPCRGRQGFWTLPSDVEAAVLAQLEGPP